MLRSHDLWYNEFRIIINVEHYFMENNDVCIYINSQSATYISYSKFSYIQKLKNFINTNISWLWFYSTFRKVIWFWIIPSWSIQMTRKWNLFLTAVSLIVFQVITWDWQSEKLENDTNDWQLEKGPTIMRVCQVALRWTAATLHASSK